MSFTAREGDVRSIDGVPIRTVYKKKGPEFDRMMTALDRQEHALTLKRAGASNTAIGRQLGISAEGARKLVERALTRRLNRFGESQDEVKVLELERLDELLVRLWRRAVPQTLTCPRGHEGREEKCPVCGALTFPSPPDQGAVDRVIKIMERRAKLLGLDAPTQIEMWTIDTIDAQIRKLEQEMAARALVEEAEGLL